MRGKLTFITGLGIGYLLGARQGRGAYEQLKRRATRTLHGRPVQGTLTTIQDLVRDRIPVIGTTLASALGQLVDHPATESRDDTADRDDRP